MPKRQKRLDKLYAGHRFQCVYHTDSVRLDVNELLVLANREQWTVESFQFAWQGLLSRHGLGKSSWSSQQHHIQCQSALQRIRFLCSAENALVAQRVIDMFLASQPSSRENQQQLAVSSFCAQLRQQIDAPRETSALAPSVHCMFKSPKDYATLQLQIIFFHSI